MNSKAIEAAVGLVPYVTQAREARKTHEKQIKILIEQVISKYWLVHPMINYLTIFQKKLPNEGWDDARIQLLLQELSLMDSNNFPGFINYTCTIVREYHEIIIIMIHVCDYRQICHPDILCTLVFI